MMDLDTGLAGYLTITPPSVVLRKAQHGQQYAGHRCVVIAPDGYRWGLRAVGALVRGPIPGVTDADDTRWHIGVVPEHLWFEHRFTGGVLEPAYWPVESWPRPAGVVCLAWVE